MMIDFSDNAAVQDALVTNAIQTAGQLDPPQLASLANTSGVKAVASRTGQFKPFTMRVDQAPFRDPGVWQAMLLLVDRQQLIDSALDGYGIVASDVFTPYDPDFDRHCTNARYASLYEQANATGDGAKRKQILYEMQQFDFTQGAYIIPTFMDTLDAYSDKITGYSTSKVGESLANWDFEHFSFV